MKIKIIIFLLLTCNCLFGQQYVTIRGKIIDAKTSEPIFAANVGIKGTTIGISSDFDGNFELKIPYKKTTLSISYIGYQTKEIENIDLNFDKINLLETIKLNPSSIAVGTVNVSSQITRNTETAILIIKKKSPVLMDAISAQSLKKSGDGNAAAAIKRVSGISITNGKYVYVRGLGDRYTKTQLNSLDLPGLDPDRNAIQVDIFPTNIIDNIIIYKSFSANLPADFTGGIVDIQTKSLPENKTIKFSGSLGYNPLSNLNSQFLTYNGGNYDFLGIDDGTRTLPINKNLQITQVDRITNYNNLIKWSNAFSNELATIRAMSLINSSFSVSGGNQFNINDKKIGFIGTFSFKNNYDYFSETQQNYWRKPIARNEYDLEPAKLINGDLGIQNAKISCLLGTSFKNQNFKYKLNFLYLRDTEKKAGVFNGENFFSNVNIFKKDILEFTERSLANIMLSARYNINDGKQVINWKISPTISKIRDKDLRETPYLVSIIENDTTFAIDVSNVGNPNRIWRYLDEFNLSSSLDILNNHEIFNKEAKLNTGLNCTYKSRSYNVLGYSLTAYNGGQISYTGDPNEIMNSLLNETNSQAGFHIIGGEQLSNKYEGNIINTSVYISEELNINKKLKSVLGTRIEYYQQYYSGQNQGGEKYVNKLVLEDIGIFPSLNLIYDLDKKSKTRFAISKTTARPSFKEKSLATIYDGISAITFNGNIDLKVSDIYNFDFRFERYWHNNQTTALSLFHKRMYNPIEIASFRSDPDNIQPINTETSEILGLEFEIRKNIFSNLIHNFYLSANSSIIQSKAYIEGEELDSRLSNLRENETIQNTNGKYFRQMQGQAPYMINLSFSYQNKNSGLETGLFYNVQGETLSIVSMNLNPDIYTSPFHSLNFNFNKNINSNFSITLGVDNLLNQKKIMRTSSFNSESEVFKSYKPGSIIKFKINYQI